MLGMDADLESDYGDDFTAEDLERITEMEAEAMAGAPFCMTKLFCLAHHILCIKRQANCSLNYI
jgi:hypothetical protein